MTMVPTRTVQDSCGSEIVRGNSFPVIEMVSMVRSLMLRYARAVRELALLQARLALLEDGAPLRWQLLDWHRAQPHANVDAKDALGAVVTLVRRV